MQISIIIILILSLVIILIRRSLLQKKRTQIRREKLVNAFHKIAFQNKLVVEHFDLIDNRLFALDRINKKMIVIDHTGNEKQELCIPLVAIQSSNFNIEKTAEENTEKIFLYLYFKGNRKPESICFFDHSHDHITQFPFLSRKAINWKNRIDIYRQFRTTGVELL